MKNKYVFIGDIDSINLEIISRSHLFLKNKVKYILLGRHNDIHKYLKKIKSKVKINQIIDPLNFENLNDGALNLYNIENRTKKKYENLMNQIKISNKHHNYNNHVKSVMKFSDYRPYYKNNLIIDKVKNYYKDDF